MQIGWTCDIESMKGSAHGYGTSEEYLDRYGYGDYEEIILMATSND